LRFRRTRRDTRSGSRRLVDEESREFVAGELEETRELYRTSTGEFMLEPLCRSHGFVDRIFNGPLQYREHRRAAV